MNIMLERDAQSNVKICFLLPYLETEYEGVARPFLNLAKASENDSVLIILLGCGKRLEDFVAHLGRPFVSLSTPKDIPKTLNDKSVDCLVVDDSLTSLRVLPYLSGIIAELFIYVQVLFGIHAFSNVFDTSTLVLRERVLYALSSFLPRSFIRNRYLNYLKLSKYVISNSKITSNLLHVLYGVKSDCVLYPSIDTDIFSPCSSKQNEVLVYLGSHGGDTPSLFTENIVENISRNNKVMINLLGNKTLARRIQNKFPSIKYHSGISDRELAKLYSSCLVTICPQVWEQFGYVPVESISCGTPVVAFNYMGPAEVISHGITGWLSNNDFDFISNVQTAISVDTSCMTQNCISSGARFSNHNIQQELQYFLSNLKR